MAFCVHCGKQLVEGARSCTFCGQSTSGNIALQERKLVKTGPEPVKATPVVSKQAWDAEKIIAHLRNCLGMNAEKVEDGGVRVVGRLKENGNYLLDQAMEIITTPEQRKLNGIRLPEGVTEIDAGAFHDCSNMKKATVKCPMRVMPAALFMACEELEEVILPAELEEIEDEAFEHCGKLKKLHLPARLKAVASGAFYECPADIIRQVKAAFPSYKEY